MIDVMSSHSKKGDLVLISSSSSFFSFISVLLSAHWAPRAVGK